MLVTGAQGCLGAWVVAALLERGRTPVVLDLAADPRRLRLVAGEDAPAAVRFVRGDVARLEDVTGALEASGASAIVHLAGLQVPFCAADPPRGARVNVVGTLNVFEAAKRAGIPRVAYASSAAVYGPDEGRAVTERDPAEPTTHYGVFKRANEGNARVYFASDGIHSAGLRPLTVYGVGRDQGLTSDLSRAIHSAVLGRPFTIRFGGATDVVYARDVAEVFVRCAEEGPPGAHVFNVHGERVEVARWVELVDEALPPERRGLVTFEGAPLPIAAELDGSALDAALSGLPHTSAREGIAATVAHFERLAAEGRLDDWGLDA